MAKMKGESSEGEQETLLRIKTEFAVELAFQTEILPSVSRSFALTIPQLPDLLCLTVSNAYLLCRIADAIEDDPAISASQTHLILGYFLKALDGKSDPIEFTRLATPVLSEATDEFERGLVVDAAKVIRLFLAFPEKTRHIIVNCLTKMCAGMSDYQPSEQRGLKSQAQLDAYCYFVAGVVGEMLTDLFCDYAPDIAAERSRLKALSSSFGQGLQMTNIIKDVWDDLDRGYCWLPRDLYNTNGYDLDRLNPEYKKALFRHCQSQLIGVAHGHLRNALDYSLTIPSQHKGIRIFCLWAVGLALPTLQKVRRSEEYYAGRTVKMSKARAVIITQLIASLASSNTAQKMIFKLLGLGLPYKSIDGLEHAQAMHKIPTPLLH